MSGIEPILMAGGVWLWQSYGKDAFSWLVKRLGKQAEELKTLGWEKIDWVLASQKYRQGLLEQYGSMHIFGMSHAVPLNDIFTDVYLLDKPSALRRYSADVLKSQKSIEEALNSEAKRYHGIELVKNNERLFIFGQPGAGKTTFLKHIVSQSIGGSLNAIPIFVTLKSWSDEEIDLLDFMVKQFSICNFPDAKPFVEQVLKDGKAIVLFDGLDEVNREDNKRARITTAVRNFSWQYRGNRFVITCRTAATEHVFEGFSYCELADFTSEQMKIFVTRWFKDDKSKQEAFWRAFEQPENNRLQDLSRRPLLLTMLCLTFDETMSFPNRRAELYSEAINALLKKWDSSRGIQRDIVYKKLSLDYKQQLLMEIAAETFSKGEILMKEVDVVERITRFMRRLPQSDTVEDIDGETILKAIEAQHGLLIERAHSIFSFSHLTFHEYFAARYIVENPNSNEFRTLVSNSSDRRWREVLLISTSLLNHRNASKLFTIWNQQLQKYINFDASFQYVVRCISQQAADNELHSGALWRAEALITFAVFWTLPQVQNVIAEFLEIDNAISQFDQVDPLAISRKSTLRLPELGNIVNQIGKHISVFLDTRDISLLGAILNLVTAAEMNFRVGSRRASSLKSNRHNSQISIQIDQIEAAYLRAINNTSLVGTTMQVITLTARLAERVSLFENKEEPKITRPVFADLSKIDREFTLSKKTIGVFRGYMYSFECLLECLSVASLEDRREIPQQFLLVGSERKRS